MGKLKTGESYEIQEKKEISKNTKPKQTIEETKEKIINTLIDRLLIKREKAEEIKDIKGFKEYINNLYLSKHIDKEQFINIWVESGILKLGNYLVLKGIVSEGQLNQALLIQSKSDYKKELGEILIQEGFIDSNTLIEALEKLGIIRIGEYLEKIGKITKEQKEMFLKIQKTKNISFGKLLIEHNIITQKELNIILEKLGIINIDDFGIDHELDYYLLKEE